MMIVGRVIVILKKTKRTPEKGADQIASRSRMLEPYASIDKSQVKALAIATSLKNLSPTIGIYANDLALFGFGLAPIICFPWAL
jgi:hypothetical protein